MKKPTAPASAYNTNPSTDCRREARGSIQSEVGSRGPLGPADSYQNLEGDDFYHTNLQGNEDGAGTDGKGEHSDHHTHHQVGVQDLTLQSQEKQLDCLPYRHALPRARAARIPHPSPQTGASSLAVGLGAPPGLSQGSAPLAQGRAYSGLETWREDESETKAGAVPSLHRFCQYQAHALTA